GIRSPALRRGRVPGRALPCPVRADSSRAPAASLHRGAPGAGSRGPPAPGPVHGEQAPGLPPRLRPDRLPHRGPRLLVLPDGPGAAALPARPHRRDALGLRGGTDGARAPARPPRRRRPAMTASHAHGHGHSHASPDTARTRLAIAFGLTALIVLAQAVGSVVTGSLALLTDTAHALVDASGLLVALIAATMLLRPASPTRTWGFARIEVPAAVLAVPRAERMRLDTLRILMECTPEGVDLDEVREHLLALEHVQDVHDLHASSVGSSLPILSAHVVVAEECFGTAHAMEILEE